MRNLTEEEVRNDARFAEFCELAGLDRQAIIDSYSPSSLLVELLDEDELDGDDDSNYPYHIFNPFNLKIEQNV